MRREPGVANPEWCKHARSNRSGFHKARRARVNQAIKISPEDYTEALRESKPSAVGGKKRKKKLFKLEARYIGECSTPFMERLLGRDWRPWGSYATERARDDAIRALQKKGDWFSQRHEFRIPQEAE